MEHDHICGQCVHHQDQIDRMMASLPAEEVLTDVAELLKLFGDPTRIRILHALLGQELCVGDIAQQLDMTVSSISHQLRVLKQGRLVKSRREGKTIFYSLADAHVKTIFYHALEHVME